MVVKVYLSVFIHLDKSNVHQHICNLKFT